MYQLDLSRVITVEEGSVLAIAIKDGLIYQGQDIYIDESNKAYEQMKKFRKENIWENQVKNSSGEWKA